MPRRLMVAGGLLRTGGDDDRLLLVCNQRKRSRDWTTPGGVVEDDEHDTPQTGLTREVTEETGLVVAAWSDEPAYRVEAIFHDLDWVLDVLVYRARSWAGELRVGDDPDGIVVGARWVPVAECGPLLGDEAPPWVAEPLATWLAAAGEDGLPAMAPVWRYLVTGDDLARARAIRLVP